MPREKIDCKKAEMAVTRGPDVCKWCGRPVKWTRYFELHHRRGYPRMHDDPRKGGRRVEAD